MVLEVGADCFVHVEGVEVGFAEAEDYALGFGHFGCVWSRDDG